MFYLQLSLKAFSQKNKLLVLNQSRITFSYRIPHFKPWREYDSKSTKKLSHFLRFARRHANEEAMKSFFPICSRKGERNFFHYVCCCRYMLEQLLPFFAPHTPQHVNDNNFSAAQKIHTHTYTHSNHWRTQMELAYKSCAAWSWE